MFRQGNDADQRQMSRRGLLLAGLGLGLLAGCADQTSEETTAAGSNPNSSDENGAGKNKLSAEQATMGTGIALSVAKSPTCGCCSLWIDHLTERGMQVEISHPPSMDDAFAEQQIPQSLQSCHVTTAADGSLFVGHIPAPFIVEYLADPPAGTRGLVVPGMPIGTPGMESGTDFQPYEVLLLAEDNSTTVQSRIATAADQRLV